MRKKRIIFYASIEPMIFMYKVAKEFRKRGYETVLFTICEKNKLDWDFYKEAFDRIICSDFEFRKPSLKTVPYFLRHGFSLLRFLILSRIIRPYAVMGISGVNWQIKLAHNLFYKKNPFIFYTYDIRSQFFASRLEALKKTPEFEIDAELYNFENCDGIVHKGAPDELEYLEGRIFEKIKFPELQLSFPPYCSKDLFAPLNKNKLSKKDKELHLVFVGYLPTGHGSRVTELINKFLKQKIHIHIYPLALAYHLPKEKEKEYTMEFFSNSLKNPRFHIEKTFPPKRLAREISKYDFGIIPYSWHSPTNAEATFLMANKITSYLEAGIPVLADEHFKFVNKLLKSYGLEISYNEKNLKNMVKRLKSLNYKILERRVEKMRQEFNVENHFKDFMDFIMKIIAKKSP